MEEIEYESGFRGWLCRSERDRAGLLVLHGGAGIGEHERSWTADLARQGYTTLLPDLFGVTFRDRAHGVEVITALVSSPEILRARLQSALSAVERATGSAAPLTSAVGFCFGGLAALELARSGADVRAVVSIHGGLQTRAPARKGEVRARVLVCAGGRDPHVTREQRVAWEEEMASADVDWHMNVYGRAVHGFTEQVADRPGCSYDEAAARATRAATLAFLEASLA